MNRRKQRRQPKGTPAGGRWANEGGGHGDISDLPPIPSTATDLDEPFSGSGYGPYRIDSTRIRGWYEKLADQDQIKVREAMRQLSQSGPHTGAPYVKLINHARHHNLKELRPRPGSMRILFYFDPVSNAYMLVAGDKRGQWDAWYQKNIPVADRIIDERSLR